MNEVRYTAFRSVESEIFAYRETRNHHSTKPIDMEEEEEEEEKVWASGVRQKCLEPDLADS
ncbi:hypothetical protein BLOT_009761 [Blomia tropicalis]|nr:hypothetical protein BLOT_009761 [Blomia tropicalis]